MFFLKRPSFQNRNRGRNPIYTFLKNYVKQFRTVASSISMAILYPTHLLHHLFTYSHKIRLPPSQSCQALFSLPGMSSNKASGQDLGACMQKQHALPASSEVWQWWERVMLTRVPSGTCNSSLLQGPLYLGYTFLLCIGDSLRQWNLLFC